MEPDLSYYQRSPQKEGHEKSPHEKFHILPQKSHASLKELLIPQDDCR